MFFFKVLVDEKDFFKIYLIQEFFQAYKHSEEETYSLSLALPSSISWLPISMSRIGS